MMIAMTMSAATSERARSRVFDPGFGAASGRHGLFRRLQFAGEPANSPGFHRIRRDGDLFEVIAFGAFERAKFKSCGPRRDPREPHARSAFRAVELLNGEQRDCGWVIGHGIPPCIRRERKTLSHR
jgi:hypothetical protein